MKGLVAAPLAVGVLGSKHDAAIAQQKALAQEEIDLLRAKIDNSKEEGAMINVNGDGLEPHLEKIMQGIFEKIQIRATQDDLDSLVVG